MIKYFTLITFTLLTTLSHAQILWDGGGDGTSWNDPANWDGDVIPGATDVADLPLDAVITGTVTTPPLQVKVTGRSNVTLNLDLPVGNANSDQHAFTIGSACTVVFGSDVAAYTFDFNTASNKNGLANFASGDSAVVRVAAMATMNLVGHSNAINFVAEHTTFRNDGTLNFDASVKNGIKSSCQFENNGSLTFAEVSSDGIIVQGGQFSNLMDGMISLQKVGDDGVDVINAGVFINEGSIEGVLADGASSGKNGISVGTADTLGQFFNMETGIITLDGGISDAARSIAINEEGSFTNSGSIIVTGGNIGTSFYSRNEVINAKNGVIHFDNGRLNINEGSFLNKGLITKSGSGPGVFSGDSLNVLINEAFFRYDSSGVFAGGMGKVTDDGLKLTKALRAVIDANGNCNIDVAQTGYDWFIGNDLYASSDETGSLTFSSMSLEADSVVLKTTIADVNIKVINVCNDAVISVAVEDIVNSSNYLKLVPNLINQDQMLNISILEVDFNPNMVSIFSQNGQEVLRQIINGDRTISLDVSTLNQGLFVIRATDGITTVQSRFVKL